MTYTRINDRKYILRSSNFFLFFFQEKKLKIQVPLKSVRRILVAIIYQFLLQNPDCILSYEFRRHRLAVQCRTPQATAPRNRKYMKNLDQTMIFSAYSNRPQVNLCSFKCLRSIAFQIYPLKE